jgi:immune inhibitor A
MSQHRRPSPRSTATALLLACCIILSGLGAAGCAASPPESSQVEPALTSVMPTPTETTIPNPPPAASGEDTLALLRTLQVPAGSWRDEAIRLKGIPDIPEVVSTTPANHALGDSTGFYIINADTREPRQLSARLVYETENVYFFVEQDVDVVEGDVMILIDEFQNKTYPTNRQFFGSEWIPGVDGDPHLYILYARGLGKHTQAYYDSASEYSRLAHPYSNEKEIIVLNADAGALSDDYWRPTLAHEFQHMIHWRQKPNAETWLNEGASLIAQTINGFEAGSKMAFLNRPDLQLNHWVDISSSLDEVGGHYDAAYLFMLYFLDRFGREAIQTLVTNPATGITAVDSTLETLTLTDPVSGKALTVEDVFADWVVANYINNSSLAQGQYGYQSFTERAPGPTDLITGCPTGLISASVHQFGTRYVDIGCEGSLTIHFSGSPQVSLAPTQAYRGDYVMWSSRQDGSDTTLTREFDLSSVETATLDYWAWWKIEKDYDYAYVEVSQDGGKTWNIIQTNNGTGDNPTGGNQGWGYTGCSGGGDPGIGCRAAWINEQVDLSTYAGQKILVRFEYLTDAALSYDSFMLDEISVPEINYSCSFEMDHCGWESQGFGRIDNTLPQTFIVQLIHQAEDQTTVQRMILDANRQGSLSLNVGSRDSAILVISGATPFTTQKADFELEIQRD